MDGKGRINKNKLSLDGIKDILRSNAEDVIKIMLTYPHQYDYYVYVTLIGKRIYYGAI